jgi:DNA adenine methylase
MRHVEPFVGGGALFFSRRPRRALLTDINPSLVATYSAIRDDVGAVIGGLRRLASRHSKESYYQVRERYNQGRRVSTSKRAAMFIYLNKTCFNGLHRVNRKGAFNVPVGAYKNPRILNEDGLQAASQALQGADLRCASFDTLLENAKPGDFVYFDPPYEPVSQTASFTSYSRDGFSREDQTRLRDVYKALDRRGCKLMLSNSDVPFIRDLYRDFEVDTVAAPRAINCDATKRGKVSEVVVRNY